MIDHLPEAQRRNRSRKRIQGRSADERAQAEAKTSDDYTLAVMSNYGNGAQPIVEKARSLILAGRAQSASR